MTKTKQQKKLFNGAKHAWMFLLPFIALYVVFGLFPIVYSFIISLTDWTFGKEVHFIGFKNYIDLIFHDKFFWLSVGNTFLLMLMYIPASLILAIFLANLIFQKETKGKRFFQIAFFAPNITTAVAVGLMFALIFDWQTGVLNGILNRFGLESVNWLGQPGTARFVVALMAFWGYFGYCTIFYLSGMAGISDDLYEAAMLDGANKRQMFWHITFPNLKQTTSFLLITSIISGAQIMEEPQLLLNGWATVGQTVGGPGRSCLTIVWYLYDTAFGGSGALQYGKGATIGYVSFVILMVVIFGFQAISGAVKKARGKNEDE